MFLVKNTRYSPYIFITHFPSNGNLGIFSSITALENPLNSTKEMYCWM